MQRGLKKTMWGFIFLLFHINIGAVQILPNCISYYIIYSGVNIVTESFKSKAFERCKNLLWINIIASFIEESLKVMGQPIFQNSQYTFVYTSIMCILRIVIVYLLFNGIIELLKEYSFGEMGDSFIKKQKGYIIADTIISMVVLVVTTFSGEVVLVGIVAIIALFLQIWLITCINAVSKMDFKQPLYRQIN